MALAKTCRGFYDDKHPLLTPEPSSQRTIVLAIMSTLSYRAWGRGKDARMAMAIIVGWIIALVVLVNAIGKVFECLRSLVAPANALEDHQESHT